MSWPWIFEPLAAHQTVPPGFRPTTLKEKQLIHRYRLWLLDQVLGRHNDLEYQDFLHILANDEVRGGNQNKAISEAIKLLKGPYKFTDNVKRDGWYQLRENYYIYPWTKARDVLHEDWQKAKFFMTFRAAVGENEEIEELMKINSIIKNKVLPLPPEAEAVGRSIDG
jgi:hypothetical protein